MTRKQVGILLAVLGVLVIGAGSMSTASVSQTEQSVPQVIADPFCATSDDSVNLVEAGVMKQQDHVHATWTFASRLPARAVVKADLAAQDGKYHWLLLADVEAGHVSRIETLDSVSNQVVGYDVSGASTSSRVIGDQVQVIVPLPGVPDTFSWYAAAAVQPADTSDMRSAAFAAFCPAGWLAQYPPAA